MVFSSIFFLCFFLPVVIGIYYLLPKKCRNIWLLVTSLFFYGFGEPEYILLMILSIVINYLSGIYVSKVSCKKLVLVLCIIVNIGLLVLFKYADLLINVFNELTKGNVGFLSLALPIGISFYTFQALSYVIDVYRKDVEVQRNILNFGMYICLFPQLIAGPIVRYKDIEKQVNSRNENVELFFEGLYRFALGLGKKVLLANQIGSLWNEINSYATRPMLTAWIGALAFGLQIYFDFSGYSDMAIGLGKMFGFEFVENFDYPYMSRSISEFWRKWHITLGTWFREYIYIPLGGNRKGNLKTIFNLFIVWTLTGLWHGANYNFIIWGLYFFVFLILEKYLYGKYLEKYPFLGHLYTLIVLLIGWVIFAIDDVKLLQIYLGNMFDLNNIIDNQSVYYLLSYGSILVIGMILSTNVFKKLELKNSIIKMSIIVILIALSLIFLVSDSFNPFLYFRF